MTTSFKLDTRIALIEAGKEIMFEKGYSNTGILEVLNKVGVPKGSFYHYFDSKEDFAVKIIEHVDKNCMSKTMAILQNNDISPLQRLIEYCKQGKDALSESQCRKGCLIGNLSQEMADQSETLRKALSVIMTKWKNHLSQCIKKGQNIGEINKAWPAEKMAELFISGWEGALMRSKTIKSVEPLNDFTDLMFNHILKRQ
jgi:TetR/AcrR family transcriptional repressor of nem operon